jgi:NADH-quinone oxidoreductase subunit J
MTFSLIFHLSLLCGIAASSYCVITSKSPVDSVLFLILVFLNSAAYLILIEAEFLALIFLVIYVGAIAVLFLFIVMMLNIKTKKEEVRSYGTISFFFGLIFFFELSLVLGDVFKNFEIKQLVEYPYLLIDQVNNIDSLGQCLYTDFSGCFLLAGILLLIAMVGAIVLTVRFVSSRKNEIAPRQISRSIFTFSF